MNSKQTVLNLKDNTSIGITTFQAESSDAAILVLYPAFGVTATYYQYFAAKLATAGITVVTADLRGHGLSSVRPNKDNNYGFLEMINDLKAILDHLKQANSRSKIYLLGHSLGGQAASLMMAKYPKSYDGLTIIGSPNVYYKGWSGFHYYRRKIGLNLLPAIGKVVSLLPPFKIGGYYTTPKQMIEWGHTGKTGNYKVIGDDFDYEKGFSKVTVPILAIDIEGDLMAPKAAMTNLYQKFKNTIALSTLTLTKKKTSLKITHINWPRTAEAVMVEVLREWIDRSN